MELLTVTGDLDVTCINKSVILLLLPSVQPSLIVGPDSEVSHTNTSSS